MKKLINYLKRNNINFKLINEHTVLVCFTDNFKVEINIIRKLSQTQYNTTVIYKDKYLFNKNYSPNLKELIKTLSYLQHLLDVYDFDADNIDGLVYFNSIYHHIEKQ